MTKKISDLLHLMSDEELINYAKHTHISLDSEKLIAELCGRLAKPEIMCRLCEKTSDIHLNGMCIDCCRETYT